jgi:hypothetical protein
MKKRGLVPGLTFFNELISCDEGTPSAAIPESCATCACRIQAMPCSSIIYKYIYNFIKNYFVDARSRLYYNKLSGLSWQSLKKNYQKITYITQ